MIVQSNSTTLLQPKDILKSELKDFSNKNGYDLNRNGDSGPLLLDVIEGFLKYENLSQGRGSNRRMSNPEAKSISSMENQNVKRFFASSVAGGLPPLGRHLPSSLSSDRWGGSSSYRKDEYDWRYDNDEIAEDVVRASAALEYLQLDRKARYLTTSWRHTEDETLDDSGRIDNMKF